MKKIIFALLTLVLSFPLFSQSLDSIRWVRHESTLFGGYNYNIGGGDAKHIFELGVKRSDIATLLTESVSASTYYGCDFIFEKHGTTYGPKIGEYAAMGSMAMGGELTVYTDGDGASVVLTPYLGFGTDRGRLSVNFPITLYRHNIDYVNTISLHISVPLYTFQRKSHSPAKQKSKEPEGIYL